MNPYKTNVEVWEDKALGKKPEPINPNILARGHKVEPLLRGLFEVDFPNMTVLYDEDDHRIHQEYEFMRANLDGHLIENDTGRNGVLEIKHVELMSGAHREKWKRDSMPDNYYCQVIWYLMVTGYDFAILKARLKSVFNDEISVQVKHYRIERSEVIDDMEHLKQVAIEFWTKYVVPKIKPPLILPHF